MYVGMCVAFLRSTPQHRAKETCALFPNVPRRAPSSVTPSLYFVLYSSALLIQLNHSRLYYVTCTLLALGSLIMFKGYRNGCMHIHVMIFIVFFVNTFAVVMDESFQWRWIHQALFICEYMLTL